MFPYLEPNVQVLQSFKYATSNFSCFDFPLFPICIFFTQDNQSVVSDLNNTEY